MKYVYCDCEYCQQPTAEPPFASDCRDCALRRVAGSPQFAAAKIAGSVTPEYAAYLKATFGKDGLAAHEDVKRMAQRITKMRAGEHQ